MKVANNRRQEGVKDKLIRSLKEALPRFLHGACIPCPLAKGLATVTAWKTCKVACNHLNEAHRFNPSKRTTLAATECFLYPHTPNYPKGRGIGFVYRTFPFGSPKPKNRHPGPLPGRNCKECELMRKEVCPPVPEEQDYYHSICDICPWLHHQLADGGCSIYKGRSVGRLKLVTIQGYASSNGEPLSFGDILEVARSEGRVLFAESAQASLWWRLQENGDEGTTGKVKFFTKSQFELIEQVIIGGKKDADFAREHDISRPAVNKRRRGVRKCLEKLRNKLAKKGKTLRGSSSVRMQAPRDHAHPRMWSNAHRYTDADWEVDATLTRECQYDFAPLTCYIDPESDDEYLECPLCGRWTVIRKPVKEIVLAPSFPEYNTESGLDGVFEVPSSRYLALTAARPWSYDIKVTMPDGSEHFYYTPTGRALADGTGRKAMFKDFSLRRGVERTTEEKISQR